MTSNISKEWEYKNGYMWRQEVIAGSIVGGYSGRFRSSSGRRFGGLQNSSERPEVNTPGTA